MYPSRTRALLALCKTDNKLPNVGEHARWRGFTRPAVLARDGAHNVIANQLDAFEAEMEQATAADAEA
jgi:hypothetical protein